MSKGARKDRKRLVIDASIARAAGLTDHPVSRACREFLESVLTICHRMVLTDPIREEWERHASQYTRKWRAAMWARKKVIRLGSDLPDEASKMVGRLSLPNKQRQALLKDALLIDAAMKTDSIVASRDDEARDILRGCADGWPAIRPLVWVNPAKPEEECGKWLAAGAMAEPQRMIGYEGEA
jgi:predicted nucleic acid-binding protein